MKISTIFILWVLTFVVATSCVMAYGSQVTAVKSCVVTSTYVPFGAEHTNVHASCMDGSTVDAVWALKVGCEPRTGDLITVNFYRVLWLPQVKGDANC